MNQQHSWKSTWRRNACAVSVLSEGGGWYFVYHRSFWRMQNKLPRRDAECGLSPQRQRQTRDDDDDDARRQSKSTNHLASHLDDRVTWVLLFSGNDEPVFRVGLPG